MEVTPISYTPRPADPNAGTVGNSQLGKEEFLRLLVTQLSNQDPMSPMDGQQFAAQLAQFTSVEQLINIDETLGQQGQMNALLAQSMNNGVAAGLIGKQIEAPGGTISWTGSGEAQVGYEIGSPAETLEVTIRDAGGAIIKTLEIDGQDRGRHTFTWDGTDANGASVSPGAYTVSINATDAEGESVPVESSIRGRVSRVTFGSDGIQLWIGDVPVSMGDVRSVTDE